MYAYKLTRSIKGNITKLKETHLFGLFAGCVGDRVNLNFLTGNHWPDEIIHVAMSDYITHNRFAEHGAR